jgi:hypothetical protein
MGDAESLTATDGDIPGETGVRLGEMDGAERDGVNDNDKTPFGIVPKTGLPGSEGLELAPAALYAPMDEGAEILTDWTWARVGTAPRVMDRKSASVCLMRLMGSL